MLTCAQDSYPSSPHSVRFYSSSKTSSAHISHRHKQSTLRVYRGAQPHAEVLTAAGSTSPPAAPATHACTKHPLCECVQGLSTVSIHLAGLHTSGSGPASHTTKGITHSRSCCAAHHIYHWLHPEPLSLLQLCPACSVSQVLRPPQHLITLPAERATLCKAGPATSGCA
jgi:hypothetical protein